MSNIFSKIQLPSNPQLINSYLGDDLILDLSSTLGLAVKADPTLSVSVSLIQNSVTASFGFIAVSNGLNSNDFINGVVCAVISDVDLDTLSRGRYQVVLRVESGSLRQTYKLPINVNLVNLI